MRNATQLRTEFPHFYILGCEWQINATGLQITCLFGYSEHTTEYTHRLTIPGVTSVADADTGTITTLCQMICMVEAISYWKLTCSPTIQIQAFDVTPAQLEWWHTLIMKGMGEFWYVNDIDFTQPEMLRLVSASGDVSQSNYQGKKTHFSSFGQEENVSQKNKAANEALKQALHTSSPSAQQALPHILIPLGGGKDSIVTLELIKKTYGATAHHKLGVLLINPTQASLTVATLSGLSAIHQVNRIFDTLLFERNRQGFLNGHVPVSATYAWISLLVAHLYGYDWVYISNERSANEGNVVFHNTSINHQWSKSFEFETMLHQLTATFTPPLPEYVSFLRPLYELQIAKIFAQVAQPYWQVFRSCNKGSAQNIWCGKCSKCLFAYSIILPFAGIQPTEKMFGSNLLADITLHEIALELIGKGKHKPLDCVGMFEESLVAFTLCTQSYQNQSIPLPTLLSQLVQEKYIPTTPSQVAEYIYGWNDQHLVPNAFTEVLKHYLDIPSQQESDATA